MRKGVACIRKNSLNTEFHAGLGWKQSQSGHPVYISIHFQRATFAGGEKVKLGGAFSWLLYRNPRSGNLQVWRVQSSGHLWRSGWVSISSGLSQQQRPDWVHLTPFSAYLTFNDCKNRPIFFLYTYCNQHNFNLLYTDGLHTQIRQFSVEG